MDYNKFGDTLARKGETCENPYADEHNDDIFDDVQNTDASVATIESIDYMPDIENNPTLLLKKIKLANYNRIVIAHLNINSIRNKFDALREMIIDNIDILIITETKIDESFPPSQFQIDGYKLPFRMDRTSDGVASLYTSGVISHIDN